MTYKDYWKELDRSLELLKSATGHEWQLESTGGGHTAFMLNVPNGYYMITNDALAPVGDEWDEIRLGFYEDNEMKFPYGDEGTIIDTVTTLEALTEWSILWSGNLK
jgi:hypothetical protein